MSIMENIGLIGRCSECGRILQQCEAENQVNGEKDTFVCKAGHVNFKPFNK